MSNYYHSPESGTRAAFFALNPEAAEEDFSKWKSEILRSEKDPRVPMFGPANLCEAALDHPSLKGDDGLTKEQHGLIMFALSHYQTMIEVFTAVFEYDREHGFVSS